MVEESHPGGTPNWNAWLFLPIAVVFAGIGITQWTASGSRGAAVKVQPTTEPTVDEPAAERPVIRAISLNHEDEYVDIVRGDAGWQRRDAHTGRLLDENRLSTGWLTNLQLRSRDDTWAGMNQRNELEIVHAQEPLWCARLPEQRRDAQIANCSLCAGENRIAAASRAGTLWLLDFDETAVAPSGRYELEEPLASASISPAGDRVLLITAGREALIWNVAAARVERRIDGDAAGLRFSAWSGDGRRFLLFGANRELQIRDAAGELIRRVELNSSAVIAAELSPDGRRLAVGDGEVIRLWEIDSGEESPPLVGHDALISALRFDAEGRTLFSGDNQGMTRRWSLLDHREVWLTP